MRRRVCRMRSSEIRRRNGDCSSCTARPWRNVPSMTRCDLARWNCLPPRCAVLPLVVRELFDAGTVKAHHENLTARLRRIRVRRFILEGHP